MNEKRLDPEEHRIAIRTGFNSRQFPDFERATSVLELPIRLLTFLIGSTILLKLGFQAPERKCPEAALFRDLLDVREPIELVQCSCRERLSFGL